MKYLKTWLGNVTGQLKTEFRYYNNIEDLAKEYGTQPGEKYYELVELDQQALKLSVVEALEKQNEKGYN
jgi:hypothetical protein